MRHDWCKNASTSHLCLRFSVPLQHCSPPSQVNPKLRLLLCQNRKNQSSFSLWWNCILSVDNSSWKLKDIAEKPVCLLALGWMSRVSEGGNIKSCEKFFHLKVNTMISLVLQFIALDREGNGLLLAWPQRALWILQGKKNKFSFCGSCGFFWGTFCRTKSCLGLLLVMHTWVSGSTAPFCVQWLLDLREVRGFFVTVVHSYIIKNKMSP